MAGCEYSIGIVRAIPRFVFWGGSRSSLDRSAGANSHCRKVRLRLSNMLEREYWLLSARIPKAAYTVRKATAGGPTVRYDGVTSVDGRKTRKALNNFVLSHANDRALGTCNL